MTLFLALMFKHFVADLALQAMYCQGASKHLYFNRIAHLHYFHHGILTLAVCWIFLPLDLSLVIGLVDYVIHWHIDFMKHHLNRAIGAVRPNFRWWWTNTLDACLHTATYWIIVMTVIQWPVAAHLVPKIYV